MNRTTRLLVLLAALVLLTATAVFAVFRGGQESAANSQSRPGDPRVKAVKVSLTPPERHLLVRNLAMGPHQDEVASVPADRTDGEREVSGLKCLRFFTAAGTGVCLQAEHSALGDTYHAVILDARLRELRRFPLAGVPSRARVSPSGHLVAWTVFLSGESYAGGGFSTRTSVVDTRTWRLVDTLEDFTITKEGRRYRSPDSNFWGVTFADDNGFYATLSTKGQTYLVRGDLAARSLTTLHGNVECPSLSPDGTRIAYKKRVAALDSASPWRLYVLDLATMAETPTAERRNIDDQALWADDSTLVYALPGSHGWDVWSVPAGGSGAPRKLVAQAASPVYAG